MLWKSKNLKKNTIILSKSDELRIKDLKTTNYTIFLAALYLN